MKSTWILGSTFSSSGDSNSSSDLFSLSERSILFYYLTKEMKVTLSFEINAKCVRPLEIITHTSPRSFPHTVWIPHAEMHAHSCAVCEPWRLSPPPSLSQSLSLQLNTECQIVDNDKNAWSNKIELPVDKCSGVIPHKMLPIVSIMNMKTIIADANFYYCSCYLAYYYSSVRKKSNFITLYVFFFQEVLCQSHPCFSHFSLL